jgi:hypothetical protein
VERALAQPGGLTNGPELRHNGMVRRSNHRFTRCSLAWFANRAVDEVADARRVSGDHLART